MIAYSRILLFICSIAFSSYADAQGFSIIGKVVDGDNNPIEFANVIVNNIEGDIVSGTSTDNLGNFELRNLNKNTYDLIVSFIGFDSYRQRIILTGNLDLKTISLVESAETLEQIDIIAKKPTITRKPDRLVFNIENTALVEGSTLGVLKNTPGVIVSEGGINIKNAPATVYINNRRVQLTPNELIQLLESAPANSIKSVEVITNPPASYDADSGSVINIVMSKNLVTGYRGSVFTNYTQGVFPRYNAGTSHYFKNNSINLNLNYSYSQNKINRDQDDNVNFLDTDNEVDEIWKSGVNRNTWSQNHNLNLNFDFFIDEKNTLSLTSTALYMPYFKYKIANNTTIFDSDQSFLSRFTADNLSRDDKYNIGTDLIYSHEFSGQASIVFNGHYTTYNYQRDQNVLSNFFDANNMFINSSEFNTLANQETDILTGSIDFNLATDDNSNLDLGIKYSNVKTDSDITRLDIFNNQEVINTDNSDAFKYDEKVFAGYVNYSKSWEKWDINLGLRVEQSNIEGASLSLAQNNTQDYLNWFPNLSISHRVSENLLVYSNYKRSIGRPSYTNLNPFSFFINENTVVLGNPNLIPTYLDQYKIGVSFLEHFTVEAYYDSYDGDIVELPRQNNVTNIVAFTPTNLENKVDFGFDFVFDYNISNRWSIFALTSFYNITEETDFGEGFVKQEQWSNYSILKNTLFLLEDNSLNIDINLEWSNRNLQRLQTVENRLISAINISKVIFNKRGVLSLGVEDIFNTQDYESSISYLNQSSSSFLDMDNRFIRLGFSYKFGNTGLSTNERTTDAEERDRLKDLN
ncbi:TonB-dependent receptor domain-containing protein [Winogradskyella alexanderae]|uniref:TonB-dependent receptor n=1 Tax=Winogradskyella alexanderae TaxID=2877123 RepID=A0ABS7XML5_9FLAO|nr:TonB-dependent receptor [Winogradskyella alexanderae]MCA0131245.1 TonB-dependent receptor [Winogradskyella alexanderae]